MASYPDNNSTIQFNSIQLIPYGIQEITNKDIYIAIVSKNTFFVDNSIIFIYNIEERDIGKFTKIIATARDIESINIINGKEKYFMIITKSITENQ